MAVLASIDVDPKNFATERRRGRSSLDPLAVFAIANRDIEKRVVSKAKGTAIVIGFGLGNIKDHGL